VHTRDDELPEGKVMVWSPAVDSPEDLDDEVTDVVVLAGPEGKPMYRPLVLEDKDTSSSSATSEAEERARARAYKADHLEFWQEVVGSRPKKNDVLRDMIIVVINEAGTNEYRIASKILRLDEVKTPDYQGKDSTSWKQTWMAGYEKNPTTAMLALVAGFAENNSGIHYEPDWANAIREEWGYDGLTSNSEIN